MEITIRQFVIAMETYGAKKMPDIKSPRTHCIVPVFRVGEFEFLHSGSDYVVPYMRKIPDEIIQRAIQECGEEHISEYQLVFSIKGMLTLAAMIDNKYSKDSVDGMINKTYQKLLSEMDIYSSLEFPFQNAQSPKMEELCNLLTVFCKVVNPFESGMKLKDPIDYLNLIERISCEDNTRLCLSTETESACTLLIKDKSGWMYHGKCSNEKNHNKGGIVIEHNYNDGTNQEFPLDETVLLSYESNEETQEFVLEISLKTGLAWENYEEEKAMPVTEGQIQMVIDCLKISIEQIRQNIVRYMVSDV